MDYIGGLSTSFSWTKSVYLTEWAQLRSPYFFERFQDIIGPIQSQHQEKTLCPIVVMIRCFWIWRLCFDRIIGFADAKDGNGQIWTLKETDICLSMNWLPYENKTYANGLLPSQLLIHSFADHLHLMQCVDTGQMGSMVFFTLVFVMSWVVVVWDAELTCKAPLKK